MSNTTRGFTLIELAIALIIMTLLVGGVVAGGELIRASELRAIISEVKEHKVSIDNFKRQYEELPGDFTRAADFFSGATAGDGDGHIDEAEYFHAWNQLGLSGMITGSYSGAGAQATIGTNVPGSSYRKNSGFSLAWQVSPGPTAGAINGWRDTLHRYFSGNYITFGEETGSSKILTTSSLNADDAFYIDNKIDDAEPDSGYVLGETGSGSAGCAVGNDPASDSGGYDFSAGKTKICILHFALE